MGLIAILRAFSKLTNNYNIHVFIDFSRSEVQSMFNLPFETIHPFNIRIFRLAVIPYTNHDGIKNLLSSISFVIFNGDFPISGLVLISRLRDLVNLCLEVDILPEVKMIGIADEEIIHHSRCHERWGFFGEKEVA